jgi:hypothetical protein
MRDWAVGSKETGSSPEVGGGEEVASAPFEGFLGILY